MKTKFTYKELTLILGIFVALIIVFALWSNGYKNIFNESSELAPDISIPAVVNFVAKSISSLYW